MPQIKALQGLAQSKRKKSKPGAAEPREMSWQCGSDSGSGSGALEKGYEVPYNLMECGHG